MKGTEAGFEVARIEKMEMHVSWSWDVCRYSDIWARVAKARGDSS